MKKYAYAVMDGNEAPDQFRCATSCHMTQAAAAKACARLNRSGNDHYYVVEWDASRWAREQPAPRHPTPIYGRTP